MDFSKLKPGDWALGGGGLVLFIASFLPWFGWSEAGLSDSGNGWDVGFFWGGIPALLGLALAGLVVLEKFTDVELPEVGNLGWGLISLIAAAVAGGIVLLKLLLGHSVSYGFGSYDFDRKWGLFLAAIGGVAAIVGGVLRFQEEKAGASGGGAAPPPPPPAA